MQSSTCLLKTRRLVDCHMKCLAPRRQRCSLLQPPERVCASARLTWLWPPKATQFSTVCVISLVNGTGTYDVYVEWTCACAFSRTRESGAWERLWILVSAAAVVMTSAVVSQRKTISSCSLVTNPNPELFFLKAVIVSVFKRRSAPHDPRRAVASAFRSSTLVIFLS